MITEKEIGAATNVAKFKYADLDKELAVLKIVPVEDKFVILFDISYQLGMLDFFGKDGDKVDPKWTDSKLSEELMMRIVYSLLNSVAHYRHYIQTKLRTNDVVIIYSSDPNLYDRYSKTFDRISKLVNLFKGIIFIEKIDNAIPFIYQHMAYFLAMNVSSMNNTKNKKTRIIYIGQQQIAPQLLRIDKGLISIRHKQLSIGSNAFFSSYEIENSPPGYRDINLITSILAINGVRTVYPKLDSLRGVKAKLIYRIIHNNCANFVDKDNPTNITNGLYLSEQDEGFFKGRLQALDIDFHDKLFALSKQLINVWSSKIETNQIYNLNEQFKFQDLTLNVSWLTI